MRRDHHHHQQPQADGEDPLVAHLDSQYGRLVAHGLIEARVASAHCDGADPLSAEHLARAEVASLAAAGPRQHPRSRR